MSKRHMLVKLGWERYEAPKENLVHFVENELSATHFCKLSRN